MRLDSWFSKAPCPSDFLLPYQKEALKDYEYGGEKLNYPPQSYLTVWKAFYENGIQLSNGTTRYMVLDISMPEEIAISFDLNMRPIIAYILDGICFFNWYDAEASKQVTSKMGSNYSFINLSLDDSRKALSASSDVIFSYIRNNMLCMRIQRERFLIEHPITKAKALVQAGMMKNYRFGFTYYDWD